MKLYAKQFIATAASWFTSFRWKPFDMPQYDEPARDRLQLAGRRMAQHRYVGEADQKAHVRYNAR
jgi:hypothetical protein